MWEQETIISKTYDYINKTSVHSVQPFAIKTGWERRKGRETPNTHTYIFIIYGKKHNSPESINVFVSGMGGITDQN